MKQRNPRRDELISLSVKIRPYVKINVFKSINEGVRSFYRSLYPSETFDTFAGWRANGYKVKKGSHGLPIWASPRNGVDWEKVPADSTIKEGDNGELYEFFPICYLFSSEQVEPIPKAEAQAQTA